MRPLSEDTPVNRFLLAAGVRAQHLLSQDSGKLTQLRECLIALSGARLEPRPPAPFVTAGTEPATQRALTLGRAIMEGVPAVPASVEITDRPVSAWINVERVFEEAMLSVCARAVPGKVAHGHSLHVPLFFNLPGEEASIPKVANPDIVIRAEGVTLVLDAKYRRSGEYPTDPELYQLIAHAGAFEADAAAVVAPALHGQPGVRRLGRVRGGCSLDVIAVDPRDITGTEKRLADWVAHRLER